MKVILIKDVARLGRKSEVKDVPSGHALNFLIPRKLAVIATPVELKRLSEEVTKHDAAKASLQQSFSDMCALLKDKVVTFPVEANEQGHLFKGINAADISAHLATAEHMTLDKESIHLEHPIKEVGTHAVPLQFDGIKGVCTLEVVKK